MANNQDLEDWLLKIAEHTRMTREALEGKGPAAQAQQKQQTTLFDRLGKRIEQGMAAAVAQKAGQAQQLANQGFQGTVEQARYDYAMEQLSKQFAAVMKPVLDGFTYAAVQIEQRMRKMGGSEQNRLMGGIVGAGIGLRYGGVPGALAGGFLGSALMGDNRDLSTGERLAAVGSAGFLGFRTAGAYGAVAAAGAATIGTSSDYSRLRAGGQSRVKATFSMIGMGAYDAGNAVFGGPGPSKLDVARAEFDKKMRPRTGAAPRRDVTPFQAQMVGAGDTAMRIQEAMIRTTAGADFEDGGPFKPFVDAILAKLDVLIGKLGPAYRGPEPRSAMESRG